MPCRRLPPWFTGTSSGRRLPSSGETGEAVGPSDARRGPAPLRTGRAQRDHRARRLLRPGGGGDAHRPGDGPDIDVDDAAGALTVVCESDPCGEPGSRVTATVTYAVALPGLPALVGAALPLAVPVAGESSAVVDRFAPPGPEDGG